LEVSLLDAACARAMAMPVLEKLTVNDPSSDALEAFPVFPSLTTLALTVDSAELIESFVANIDKFASLTKLTCICDRLWTAADEVPRLILPQLTTLKLETILPELDPPNPETLQGFVDGVIGALGESLQSAPSLVSLSVSGCEWFPDYYRLLQQISEGPFVVVLLSLHFVFQAAIGSVLLR